MGSSIRGGLECLLNIRSVTIVMSPSDKRAVRPRVGFEVGLFSTATPIEIDNPGVQSWPNYNNFVASVRPVSPSTDAITFTSTRKFRVFSRTLNRNMANTRGKY